MAHAPPALAEAFARQAAACAKLGSPLWARLMAEAADDIAMHGPLAALLADWQGDLEQGALALRLAGGLHYLALSGQAPTLAALLPSCGGAPAPDRLWPAARETLRTQEAALRPFLGSAPQTNEVGRSCALMPGMLEVARITGLPLRPREIGSSAGLNQFWDQYSYRLGDYGWNAQPGALALECHWEGGMPPLGTPLAITSRGGCDVSPLDLRREDVRLRLQAYVWPDQQRRLANLRAAIGVALANDVHVEEMPASLWVARELAQRPVGECIVVYHSVVRQYFPAAEGRAFDDAIAAAGASATADRPVAWLRLEQSAPTAKFELLLTLWPNGETTRLAAAHPHGAAVTWDPREIPPSLPAAPPAL